MVYNVHADCDLILDDWEVDDCEDPINIQITKIEY